MLTYEQGVALLSRGRNGRRRLGNNTYLHRLTNDTLAVTLHCTSVVLVHADGTYTLNSGGWRTSTTKTRLNDYSPAHVFQKRGEWFLSIGRDPLFGNVRTVEYRDGMRIDSHGAPIMEVTTNG